VKEADPIETVGIATPRQARSRESSARVINATVELLIEKGPRGVTIADVSKRAGVSVGSIYARFGNRSALLRAAHEEELRRVTEGMLDALAALDLHADESEAIHEVVAAYVKEMRKEARVIKALVALGTDDKFIADSGPAASLRIRDAVLGALREATGPSPVEDDHWGHWVFEVMFALTLQHIEPEHFGPLTTDEAAFILNLGDTIVALATPPPGAA